jgi:hypothetical protein
MSSEPRPFQATITSDDVAANSEASRVGELLIAVVERANKSDSVIARRWLGLLATKNLDSDQVVASELERAFPV